MQLMGVKINTKVHKVCVSGLFSSYLLPCNSLQGEGMFFSLNFFLSCQGMGTMFKLQHRIRVRGFQYQKASVSDQKASLQRMVRFSPHQVKIIFVEVLSEKCNQD